MAGLSELADELEHRARVVAAAGDELAHAAATALWTSVAADAFRQRVAGRRADCDDIALRLQVAARDVRSFEASAAAHRARLVAMAAAVGRVLSW